MRIDPPPSVACAAGTIPAATAAAAPPDEPPALRRRSHGLRAGGATSGSVYGGSPSSGVVVLPTMRVPASRNRTVTPSSTGATFPRNAALPSSKGCAATIARSLTGTGTPRKGGLASSSSRSRRAAWAAWSRASSGVTCAKAPTVGPRRSARSRVCSTTSSGLTSPERTAAARSRALSSWISLNPPRYAEDDRRVGECDREQRPPAGEVTERTARGDLPSGTQGLHPGQQSVTGDDGGAATPALRGHQPGAEAVEQDPPDHRSERRERPPLRGHPGL